MRPGEVQAKIVETIDVTVTKDATSAFNDESI